MLKSLARSLQALVSACVLAAALPAAQAQAQQQAWPTRPVRIVVPFPAGGSTDIVARQMAQHLSQALGQQFVVENRAGAGGNIGIDSVAKAAPDGYTLGLATSGPLANNKLLYKNMPYDPEKDLAHIALIGEIPLVIAVNANSPIKDLRGLVQQARTGTPVSVAHPGNGTIGHLALEYLKSTTGASLQAIPYKGDGPAMNDLLGGQVQAISAPISAFLPNIQAGKIRPLAVTTQRRFPSLPNVPTAQEQGVDLQASVWFAVVGPDGVPAPIVNRLNQEINRFVTSPEGRARLAQFGMVESSGGPEALRKLVESETARWKRVVDAARITLD